MNSRNLETTTGLAAHPRTFSVALATYNGERHLQEQLDSLAAQTLLPAELVVGDDGSTDKTIEIIERFAATAPFPVHIEQNTENLGYGENFMQVASRCTSDWITFCDQDDVWLENKLARVDRIVRKNRDVGVVVHEITVVDGNLNPVGTHGMRIRFSRKIGPTKGYYRVYLGLAIVFDRSLMDIVDWRQRPDFPSTRTHDGWMSVLAYAMTNRYLSTEALSLYRRHGENVSGFHNPTLTAKLTGISSTNAEYYLYLSTMTARLSDWFRDCAEDLGPAEAAMAKDASAVFARVARIYVARKAMYDTEHFGKRVVLMTKILMTKGYLGHFRPNDYVRDLLRVFTGGPTEHEA